MLVILAVVVISHHCKSKCQYKKHHKYECAYSKGNFDLHSLGDEVEVEVKIDNGDTTIVIEVDGKQLSDEDAKEHRIIKKKLVFDTD